MMILLKKKIFMTKKISTQFKIVLKNFFQSLFIKKIFFHVPNKIMFNNVEHVFFEVFFRKFYKFLQIKIIKKLISV